MKKLIILLFGFSVYGQKLHHSMISAQGTTAHLPNGVIVRQTIGQQSVTGNQSIDNKMIGQGFQQSNWGKYVSENKTIVNTTTYPNPFTDIVNFKFSSFVDNKFGISVFDINGRLVISETLLSNNNEVSIDLHGLQQAEYLVRLTGNKFEYFTKIIKK